MNFLSSCMVHPFFFFFKYVGFFSRRLVEEQKQVPLGKVAAFYPHAATEVLCYQTPILQLLIMTL